MSKGVSFDTRLVLQAWRELRFFGGWGFEEPGDVLGVSVQTVRRDWNFAQAWLMRAMSAQGEATA
jgi:hypothetical protein